MEIIPILTLWLCMPLDSTQPNLPVRSDDLRLFPSYHVILVERMAAWHRHNYANSRRHFACIHRLPEEAYWREVEKRAHYAWDQWDDLKLAHEALAMGDDCHARYWLARFQRNSGVLRYYHGQLPCVVDISEPETVAEVVPLP